MSNKYRKTLAIYGAILACVLAIVLMLGNNYENRATRLDLKVMTLELKGDASVIDRMGKLRNLIRAKAETLQIAAIFLVVGLALFSIAITIEDAIIWPIVVASFLANVSSIYFLWRFFLV